MIELNAMAPHPDLIYEHRWKTGEPIVWDNRCRCTAPPRMTKPRRAG